MKLAVLGLWRDSEKHIYSTLNSLSDLKEICEPEFYFYENDSIDNTAKILDNWLSDKKGQLISESLNYQKYGSVVDINRFILLSKYRNKIKNTLCDTSNAPLTLLIDTDISFTNQDILCLINSIQNPTVMSIANTRQNIPDLMLQESEDSFYDVLPIRDKYNNSGLYFTDCPLLLESDRISWKANLPVRINAGFSGVAVIKTDVLSRVSWSTSGYSEHVNFCCDVNTYGGILIVPSSRPKVVLDLDLLPIKDFQTSADKQKQAYRYLNHVYSESKIHE